MLIECSRSIQLPLLDELVDTFMSRDADSVILSREQSAVAEWLASNSTFHIMRDHPDHCLFFLGGIMSPAHFYKSFN